MLQPFSLQLICGENLKEGVRRLQAIFGSLNHEAVEGKLTGETKAKFAKIWRKDRAKFEEVCSHYVQSLLRREPFQPVSGSPLRHARKLDALDLPSTTIVAIKRYLPITPIPEKHILEYRLNQIVLAEPLENFARMKDFCREVIAGRNEAMAFLFRFGGVSHPDIKLDAEELLNMEIRWNCHSPIPKRSCVSLLTEWSKKGERQEIIVSRLFQRMVLSPLIQATSIERHLLTHTLVLHRQDIILEETETFSIYVASCIMEYAFDQFFQKGAFATAFSSNFAPLFLEPAIQGKIMISIMAIQGDYPKQALSTALPADKRHLDAAKKIIEDLFKDFSEKPTAYHFAMSLLLFDHMSKMIAFQLEEKMVLFDQLYALDGQGREAICGFFLSSEERVKHSVILSLVSERKKQFDFNLAERVRFYLFLLRMGNSDIASKSLASLPEIHWPRELVLILLESQFVDSCLIDFCHMCKSHRDWSNALLPLIKIYSLPLKKVQSHADYQAAIARLLEARASLDSHPCELALYNLLMSWILACHMEKLDKITSEEKRAWLHAFLTMQPHKRTELLHMLASPHYVWPAREGSNQSRIAIGDPFSSEERAFLMVRQALDSINLRTHPCPLNLPPEAQPLSFSETFLLLKEMGACSRAAIPKDIAITCLKKLFFPQKLKHLFEKWKELARELHKQRLHLFFSKDLIIALDDCEINILALGIGEKMVGLGEWNIETADVFMYFGRLLNQALLPTGVHLYGQRLFVRHMQAAEGSVSAKRKRWIDIHRCEMTFLGEDPTCRAILAEDREDQYGLFLTIRVIHSRLKLETRSIRVALPKLLPNSSKEMLADPRFVALAVDLCQIVCDERQVVPQYTLGLRDDRKLLDCILEAAPEYAERVASFLSEDPCHARMLCLLLYNLSELKLETRAAFWELASPLPVSPPQNLKAFAGKGHLWHLETGFSLLPPGVGLGSNPTQSAAFLILFEQYRSTILRLYEDFTKSHSCWHEAMFELDLLGIQRAEKHGVDVSVNYCQAQCIESYDEVGENTAEEPVTYYQVRLSIHHQAHIYVEERFFETLSQEEIVTRISWLLGLLKSEWYNFKKLDPKNILD